MLSLVEMPLTLFDSDTVSTYIGVSHCTLFPVIKNSRKATQSPFGLPFICHWFSLRFFFSLSPSLDLLSPPIHSLGQQKNLLTYNGANKDPHAPCSRATVYFYVDIVID